LNRSRTLELPKLLIFDDIDNLLKSKVSVAILKGALAEARGKRIVSYDSTARNEGERHFEYLGKVILILNAFSGTGVLDPLIDRGIYFNIELETEELIEYIEDKILPTFELNGNELSKVWGMVKRFADSPNFSIRSVNKAVSFYKHNPDKWYQLFTKSLKK
jgi:hypothetical protein